MPTNHRRHPCARTVELRRGGSRARLIVLLLLSVVVGFHITQLLALPHIKASHLRPQVVAVGRDKPSREAALCPPRLTAFALTASADLPIDLHSLPGWQQIQSKVRRRVQTTYEMPTPEQLAALIAVTPAVRIRPTRQHASAQCESHFSHETAARMAAIPRWLATDEIHTIRVVIQCAEQQLMFFVPTLSTERAALSRTPVKSSRDNAN